MDTACKPYAGQSLFSWVVFFFFLNRPSVITFAWGRYVAFWNKAAWMLRAALRYSSAVRSASRRWGSPIRVSERHVEGLIQKQGAIKHSTSFKVSSPVRAQTMWHSEQQENVGPGSTFFRKPLSFFSLGIMKWREESKTEKKQCGKKWVSLTHFTVTHCLG